MAGEDILATYGLWAIFITLGVIVLAGIIKALTRRSQQRSPSGRRPKPHRSKLPTGKTRKVKKKR